MPAGDGSVVHALFVSKDRRIPKIRIQTRQLGNLLDKRIIVSVDSWDCLSRYPSGHYVRTIGEIGDRETEVEVSSNDFPLFLVFEIINRVGDSYTHSLQSKYHFCYLYPQYLELSFHSSESLSRYMEAYLA